MPSAPLRHHVRPLIVVLVGGAAITVMLGIMLRFVVDDPWDPWSLRLGVAGACLVLAALSQRPGTRTLVELGLRTLAVLATAWVVLLLWGNAFPPGVSSGILILQAVCLVLFPSFRDALAYTLALVVALVAAGLACGAEPQMWVGLSTTALGIGHVMAIGTRHRESLQEALLASHERLEDQVEERTLELRTEVSERRRAEVRALEASAAKSRFLATMSHELRTPLNAILGYAELVEETVDAGPVEPDEVKGDLHAIQRSGRHLLALVDDVLDLSRIEAGSLELDLCDVELPPLLHRAVDEVRPHADRKHLALGLEIPARLPPARVDAQRTLQILMNLLSNAVKFTDRGTVDVLVHRQHHSVAIEVRDTGIGIPEDGLDRLFTPFTQLDDAPTRRAGGTGLGLALSRDLAHQMGGEIQVRSIAGQGSSFTLVVPAA